MTADSDRFGDWMQTYTGRRFWPLDPRTEEVFIEDIAHALSLQCRYAGHCLRFYSVAEHSVLLAEWLQANGYDRETCLWGLLHDAGEAYVLDMIRPLKRSIPEFSRVEQRVLNVVTARYQLYPHPPEIVKEVDNRILVDEKAQNMAPGLVWGIDSLEALGVSLQFWNPGQAEHNFLSLFKELQA